MKLGWKLPFKNNNNKKNFNHCPHWTLLKLWGLFLVLSLPSLQGSGFELLFFPCKILLIKWGWGGDTLLAENAEQVHDTQKLSWECSKVHGHQPSFLLRYFCAVSTWRRALVLSVTTDRPVELGSTTAAVSRRRRTSSDLWSKFWSQRRMRLFCLFSFFLGGFSSLFSFIWSTLRRSCTQSKKFDYAKNRQVGHVGGCGCFFCDMVGVGDTGVGKNRDYQWVFGYGGCLHGSR